MPNSRLAVRVGDYTTANNNKKPLFYILIKKDF